MLFFNKFRDTIFLKKDSNLQIQIDKLKKIRESINSTEKIDYDIKMLEIGLHGEKEIEYELKHANLGMYVLHDINIEFEDMKAQFDFIVVTKAYVYLIECKNLIGNIIVDKNGQFTREYYYNGKKIKEAIYSPYTQALKHKEILKKRWMSKHNKLFVALREEHFDKLWYKPLVVLSNSKSILNTKYAPKEVRDNIVRVDQLVNYIKKDISKFNGTFSNQKNMEDVAKSYVEINSIPAEHSIVNKYSKILADNTNKKDEVKEIEIKLKNFRKEVAKEKNIPAYYVFTDDEMIKIISNKPKNIEDLKNILPEIKIKCHGNQILDLINKETEK